MQFHIYIIPVLRKEYFLITLEKCRSSSILVSLSSFYIFWKLLLRNQLDSWKQTFSSKQFFTMTIPRQVHKLDVPIRLECFQDEARYLDKRGRTNRSRTNRSRTGLGLFSFYENESTYSRSTPSRFAE